MQRIEIFRIKKTTDAITGNAEIKKSLTGKQIYWMAKLNARAASISKKTSEKERRLTDAFRVARAETKIESELKALNEQFEKDIVTLHNEEISDFTVEQKIPFANSEQMLQHLGTDETVCAVE